MTMVIIITLCFNINLNYNINYFFANKKKLLFFRGDYNCHEQSPSQWLELGVADGIEDKPGEGSRRWEQGRHPHVLLANHIFSWPGHYGDVQARHQKGHSILARLARHLADASWP